MTSGPHAQTVPQPAAGGAPGEESGTRLRLKPDGPPSGRFDGGWWPHTLDLPTELPGLSEQLTDRLGAVIRVGFAMNGWQEAPRRSSLAGRVVRLEGFRSQDEHTVHVTGANGRRLSLLVIAPDTGEADAETALRAAVGTTESTSDSADSTT